MKNKKTDNNRYGYPYAKNKKSDISIISIVISWKEKDSTVNAILGVIYLPSLKEKRLIQLLTLRFSNLIFFSQASITHAEKLEFGFIDLSPSTYVLISSSNSCGKRMPFVVERLFLYPVAIVNSHSWCTNTIPEKIEIKTLDVFVHQSVRCLCTKNYLISENNNASKCWNTVEASNHNVKETYAMADIQHNQTRLKFTFLIASGIGQTGLIYTDENPTVRIFII